jgi:choline dehydrogenase-like flavoprotein
LVSCTGTLTLWTILPDGLAYTRGSSDDYDRYAKVTNDSGWSWDNLQQYFRKVRGFYLYSADVHIVQNERWSTPADHHNTTGEFNPSVHGYNGINSVSLPGFVTPFDYRVIKATSELPNEFPFNLDTNSGRQIGIGAYGYIQNSACSRTMGIGWGQFTIKGGERSSSATSYLAPQFAKRPNLHVLVNSRVSRVLQTGSVRGIPSFRRVEFTHGSRSK